MNSARQPVDRVDLTVGDVAKFYRNGWHSWSPSGWIDPTAAPPAAVDRIRAMGSEHPDYPNPWLESCDMAMVEHDDLTVTLVGALGPGGWVRLEDGALVRETEGDPVPWYIERGPEREVLRSYAAALGEALGSRSQAPRRVWCSWYSYYEDISEDLMREAIAGLEGLAFDVVEIDDGWQRDIGDWEANSKFPAGMADAAGRISDAGFTPGLWLSPLIATAGSRLVAEHSDWLLRDPAGAPVVAGVNWGQPYHVLDAAHPGAMEYVETVVARALEWGYRYLKLDFLYGGGLPGGAGVGSESYRSAIEVIRRAAGDDCYLMACGAPIVGSVGLFDGIRIGPDVTEWWFDPNKTEGTRNAIETTAGRLWLRDLLDVDPDVSFFRTKQMQLGGTARRLLNDLGHITRFKGISDPPSWLLPEERDRLGAYLEDDFDVEQLGRYEWALDGRSVDLSIGFSQDEPQPRRSA